MSSRSICGRRVSGGILVNICLHGQLTMPGLSKSSLSLLSSSISCSDRIGSTGLLRASNWAFHILAI
jgi:hypothetical protein